MSPDPSTFLKGFGGWESGTAISAVVSGTVSKITGGKFANGAVTGAFVHLFNDVWADSIAKRIAFGDRSYKALAKTRREAAAYMSFVSAVSAKIKSSITQIISKVAGGMSVLFTYEANYYEYKAGKFKKETFIMDTITTHTKYCTDPLGEFFYDQVFNYTAPIIFEY